jgi:hypothetical protein
MLNSIDKDDKHEWQMSNDMKGGGIFKVAIPTFSRVITGNKQT